MTNVGIIGIGLIGGSLLKTLKKHSEFNVFAVSRSETTINKISKEGLAQEASSDFNILKACNIVIIASPINKTIETIDKLRNVVGKNCIITDVASLKGFIIEDVNSKPPINFIGGHPMAGTENKGFDAAEENLFENAKWVLTPSKYSSTKDIEALKKFITKIGAIPIETNPETHDKAVSLISHTPMLVSEAIFSVLNNIEDKNLKILAQKLASSGFRDATRLAMSNCEMAKDMLNLNKENINEVLKLIKKEADLLLDEKYFDEKIIDIIENRKKMYSKEGKNIL